MPDKYVFQDYVQRVLSLIADGANKLTVTAGGDIDELIMQAVAIYDQHKPHYVRTRIESTGATSYNIDAVFGALWSHSVSRIEKIEYPVANVPPTFFTENVDWYVYDTGEAQDGSSLNLYFFYVPTTGEYFAVEFRIEMYLTRDGGQNYPHNTFDFGVICLKAAELCFLSLASKFAQHFDTTITADAVNYGSISSKYHRLAEEKRKEYNRLVFGSDDAESQVKPAMIEVDLDLPSQADVQGKTPLFHED